MRLMVYAGLLLLAAVALVLLPAAVRAQDGG